MKSQGVITELQNAIACATRVFELLEQPSESPERAGAVSPTENFEERWNFIPVDFSYVKGQPLIEDFSLDVKPGQLRGDCRSNRKWKTTLINLLMRFYDINSGKLAIDGHSIEDITVIRLRNGFWNGASRNMAKRELSVKISRWEPTISEEEMIHIAKLCHIHGFVKCVCHKDMIR